MTREERLNKLIDGLKKSCLECAEANGLTSIAFCCISTGEFHYPNREAAEIALASVEKYFADHHYSSINTVVFNVFRDLDFNIYSKAPSTKIAQR